MSIGLDIFDTLHRIVREALDSVPGAQRGSLLIQDGERLVYRAAVGLDSVLPGRLRIPSDAGAASDVARLDAQAGGRVVPAAAWYRDHLPGAAALDHVPADAVVVLTPVRAHGQSIGLLALELPAGEVPPGALPPRLQALADSAGVALERRELYDDKARGAQESRLLEEILNAVAARASPHELVEIVSNGIKSVQRRPQWTAVELFMLDDAGREGSSASGPPADHELRVYRVPWRAPTAYWNNMRDGALAAGRNLGITADFRIGTADGKVRQVDLLDDGIRRGVHGIAVAPIDPRGVEPAIRRAAEAGIPVVTLDTPPVEGSKALVYVGTDNTAAGRLAGEMMARLLPGGGAVGTQVASLRTLNGCERIAGFRAALAGTAIAVQPPSENRYDSAAGLRLALEALQRGELAGALGGCAENGPAWGLAARALGREGDLKIVAFDLIPDTIAMLREGTIHAAVVQREHDMGYRAVQLLHDMVERGVDAVLAELPAPAGEGTSTRLLDTGVDVVTLERTPWSRALSEHLAMDTGRKAARRRPGAARAGRPVEILVIGVDAEEEGFVEERAPFDPSSLVGRVLSSGRALVIDTLASERDASPDVVEALRSGTLTLVGVPLLSRSGAFGVLVLASERRAACPPDELAFIERVADTMAVAIENARLLQRITERTQALELANQHQEALLDTILELSSPVVPIAPSILVMPVVGTMDAQRSSRFIESMLREIAERKARVVIIDVTGMAVVDAVAVDHLVSAARAASMLGAEVVLVGITKEAARLMVDQGLDLGPVVTRSTLELGFAYALSKTGGRVVYRRSSSRRSR